jgi:hypothetical protein
LTQLLVFQCFGKISSFLIAKTLEGTMTLLNQRQTVHQEGVVAASFAVAATMLIQQQQTVVR